MDPLRRNRRSKSSLSSPIDMVTGIGPKRKRMLMRRFGSLRGIKEATVDDIALTIHTHPSCSEALMEAAKAEARRYLDKRGMTPDRLEKFEIGFAPEGWQNLWDKLRGQDVPAPGARYRQPVRLIQGRIRKFAGPATTGKLAPALDHAELRHQARSVFQPTEISERRLYPGVMQTSETIGVELDAEETQEPAAEAIRVAQQPQQQVLGADGVGGVEEVRLLQRVVEYELGLRSMRNALPIDGGLFGRIAAPAVQQDEFGVQDSDVEVEAHLGQDDAS